MADKKDDILSEKVLEDRNSILVEYANYSFKGALDEVNIRLEQEKVYSAKLALLSAKSWILHYKAYAALHDPYISALSEIENTNIFDGVEDDEHNEFDSLFDDDKTE